MTISADVWDSQALVKAGVKDIVLAVNYRPEVMVAMLKQTEEEYGITITFSVETEPLGTAGPLALAREVLGKDDSPFFVLNSDVTCTYPFEAFRDFHAKHGCEGSIMVTKVAEPSAYGVVVTKPGSTVIDRFVEKPVEFVGNRINAGIYIFNPSVLDRIEVSLLVPAWPHSHFTYPIRIHSFDLRLSKRKSSQPLPPIISCIPLTLPDSGWMLVSPKTTSQVSPYYLCLGIKRRPRLIHIHWTCMHIQVPASTCLISLPPIPPF